MQTPLTTSCSLHCGADSSSGDLKTVLEERKGADKSHYLETEAKSLLGSCTGDAENKGAGHVPAARRRGRSWIQKAIAIKTEEN